MTTPESVGPGSAKWPAAHWHLGSPLRAPQAVAAAAAGEVVAAAAVAA